MKIVTVGAGGYAANYVKALLDLKNSAFNYEGIVEPYFEACPLKEEIISAGIPVYNTMEEFFSEHSADIAVISTPPFLHLEQSRLALKHGAFVLCEKPAAPTVEEVEGMAADEERYGRKTAIGYQWCYSFAVKNLKKDIIDGKLGKPKALKTIISWPRNRDYYNRGGGWGGRISKNGRLILDSIASNACAHYIHNMLYLLGARMEESASPLSAEAECMRANNIENFDTCVLRMKLADSCTAYFAATHAGDRLRNPEFIYTFENAQVKYPVNGNIVAYFKDGTQKNYGDPLEDIMQKLWDTAEYAEKGTELVCTAKTSLPHTRLIGDIYKNVKITDFPPELICEDKSDNRVFVKRLSDALGRAYDGMKMLSETDEKFASKAYNFGE